MTRCDLQASGAIELYFYDELEPSDRARVEQHVGECAECAHALEELALIRDALATRPDVSAPAAGDWSGFMARLDGAVAREPGVAARASRTGFGQAWNRAAGYLAIAAMLALVTTSITLALRSRGVHSAPAAPTSTDHRARPSELGANATVAESADADFEALTEEHFERSKLVVLGLTTKDPSDRHPSDWAYERDLASSLLSDTRMYRLAAEDRGFTEIADVMRDLELVLLQTSMTDAKDPSTLPQIQRLIQRRDLLGKMDAVAVPQLRRAAGTKGI